MAVLTHLEWQCCNLFSYNTSNYCDSNKVSVVKKTSVLRLMIGASANTDRVMIGIKEEE